MAISERTPAQLRREVEARTGCVQSMCQLGWICMGYALDGASVKFANGSKNNHTYRVVRTYDRLWRIEQLTGVTGWKHGRAFRSTRKIISPLFPGPVAAAIWLAVEIENGSVRFD